MSKIFETPLYPYQRHADQDAAIPARHKVVVIGAGDDGLPLIFDGTTDTGPSVTNKNDVTPEYGSSLEMLEEAERETGLQTQDNTRP